MHDDVPKLPNAMKALGYRTAIVGKTHYEPEVLFEWDLREVNAKKVIFDRDCNTKSSSQGMPRKAPCVESPPGPNRALDNGAIDQG